VHLERLLLEGGFGQARRLAGAFVAKHGVSELIGEFSRLIAPIESLARLTIFVNCPIQQVAI
jgi:hypothetical protein